VSVARVGIGVSLPHFGMSGRWTADLVTVTHSL
jgi:hypothetical protein